MKLRLPPGAGAMIARAAERAYPAEACGLLIGRREADIVDAVEVLCTANVATEARRFEVDPAALLGAHRAARMDDRAILGPWHSHPDADAAPSATDRARAAEADPDVDDGHGGDIWLIAPVMRGRAGPARAFRHCGAGRFEEISLEEAPLRSSNP